MWTSRSPFTINDKTIEEHEASMTIENKLNFMFDEEGRFLQQYVLCGTEDKVVFVIKSVHIDDVVLLLVKSHSEGEIDEVETG